MHGGGDDVDPLVDPSRPTPWAPRIASGDRIDQELQRHGRGARVVAGMRAGVGVDGQCGPPGRGQALLVPARGGDHEVEDLDDRGAHGPDRPDGAAGDVVGDHATVPVGDVRQRDEDLLAVEGVGLGGGVAECVDAGSLVRPNSSTTMPPRSPTSRPAALASDDVGTHADRQDHQVGGHLLTGGQLDRVGAERGHGDAEAHVDPVVPHLPRDADAPSPDRGARAPGRWPRSRVVADASMDEVLGRLDADEAAADDDGVAGRASDRRHDAVDVLDRAQRQGPLDPGERRDDRRGAGAEHERVVVEVVAVVVGQVAHGARCGRRGRSR